MSTAVRCPQCKAAMKTDAATFAGKLIRCPKCQAKFRYQPDKPLANERQSNGRSSVRILLAGGVLAAVLAGGLVFWFTRPSDQTAPLATAGNKVVPNTPVEIARNNRGDETVPPADHDAQPPLANAARQELPANEVVDPAVNEVADPAELGPLVEVVVLDQAAEPAQPNLLAGAPPPVEVLAFSPDGSQLVSAGNGQSILWNLTTNAPTTLVNSLALKSAMFSSDGQTVISGSSTQAGAWEAASGNGIASFAGELMAASADGRTVVTQISGPKFCIYDIPSGREVITFDPVGKTSGRYHIAVSNDGSLVAFETMKEVRLFDVAAARELPRITAATGNYDRVVVLKFLPDNQHLIVGIGSDSPKVLTLWNVGDRGAPAQLKQRADVVSPSPSAPALSPDGRTLAIDLYSGGILLWDTETWKERAKVPARAPVSFSADGKSLVAFGSTGGVVADAATGTVRKVADGQWSALALSPDGGRLAAAAKDGSIHLHETANNGGAGVTELASLPLPEGYNTPSRAGSSTVVFSTNGRYVVCASFPASDVLAIWDVESGKSLGHVKSTYAWSFLPGEQALFAQDVLKSRDLCEVVYDLAGGEPRTTPLKAGGYRYNRLLLSPEGKLMAASLTRAGGNGKEQIALLDPTSAQVTAVLADGTAEMFAFSSDSRLLAASERGGKVRLWDISTTPAIELPTLVEHARHKLDFVDSGAALVTVEDQRAYVYKLETGQLSHEIDFRSGHTGRVLGTAFSPTDPLFVSVGENGEALLRDRRTGNVLVRLAGHSGTVDSAGFSRDGKLLATAGEDRTLKVWKLGQLSTDDESSVERPVVDPVKPREVFPFQIREHAEFDYDPKGSETQGKIRFSDDGNTLAVCIDKLCVYDLSTRAQVAPNPPQQELHFSRYRSLYSCLSPNGRMVLHNAEGMSLLDLKTGTSRKIPAGGELDSTRKQAAFSPDGKHLAIGHKVSGGEGTILSLIDVAMGAETAALTGLDSYVRDLDYTPDGSELFAIITDREGSRLVRLDPETLKERTSFGLVQSSDLFFTSDSKLVAFGAQPQQASGDQTRLTLAEVETGRVRLLLGRRGSEMKFLSGGSLAVTLDDSTLTLWDVGTGHDRGKLTTRDILVADAGRTSGYVQISRDFATSRDGRWFANGTEQGVVYFWDIARLKLIAKFKAHPGMVRALAFSPCGRYLVTVGKEDQKLKIWSL